jgi:hypothetical protein
MKQFLKNVMTILIYLAVIILLVLPIGNAASGEVIVFYRENPQPVVGDVGHVGVAIQLENGAWFAGAVEGPGGVWGVTGTLGANGGWFKEFKTKEDVIKEFASSSSHAAYTSMKSIPVKEIDDSKARSTIEAFDDYGFAIYTNNDCYTRVYDAMKAYGVDANVLIDDGFHITDKDWLRPPKDFFNDLPGTSKPLSSYKPPLSSFLKANSPLLTKPADMSSIGSDKAPYVPPTTTVTKVSYSYNIPGDWSFTSDDNLPMDGPVTYTLASDGFVYDTDPRYGAFKIGEWSQNGNQIDWLSGKHYYGPFGESWVTGGIRHFYGTIDENGMLRMSNWLDDNGANAKKIGGNAVIKNVVTTSIPSNVAGVGPLGGGGSGGW